MITTLQRNRMAMFVGLVNGDLPGHEFRGNQWTEGEVQVDQLRTRPYLEVAAYRDKDGYIISGTLLPKKDAIIGRKGQFHVTSPDGKTVKSGYWMDWPEEDAGMTEEEYRKLPTRDRMLMELKNQATKYKPLKEEFEKRGNLTNAEPFQEAVDYFKNKVNLQTSLPTSRVRGLVRGIGQRALWSSRVTEGQVLDQIAGSVQDLIAGEGNTATQRVIISKMAEQVDEPLTEGRINLILNTQKRLAFGYGQKVRSFDPDTIDEYPAWRLFRGESRVFERGDKAHYKPDSAGYLNWRERWDEAAAGTPEEGRNDEEMVAIKGHEIWSNLGSSDLFDDGLDTDHPPFAYSSGMDVSDVDRDEAILLGVIDEDTKVSPPDVGVFEDGFASSYEFRTQALLDEILSMNKGLELLDGVIRPRGASNV